MFAHNDREWASRERRRILSDPPGSSTDLTRRRIYVRLTQQRNWGETCCLRFPCHSHKSSNALPSTVHFTSLTVFRNNVEKIDFSSFFLVCLQYFALYFTCVIEYVLSNCIIARFNVAVDVLVGPCCPAVLKLYQCKCAYCFLLDK